MAFNPLIPRKDKTPPITPLNHSKGLLDDYKTSKVMHTKEFYLNGGTTNQFLKLTNSNTGSTAWADLPADNDSTARVGTITFVIDGGGSAITTGVKGDLEIPFACTIQRATALLDQSGSIVVDIWKDTYANYPPTDADSITSSAPPTVSSATKSQDSTLTGWTTSISAGDTLRFNVDSITTATRCTISLKVLKT